jgi:hypothetical protein
MFLLYQSGVLLGGSCNAGPLRSFPLARGGWSRARSSSCVLTSLPVPESSGCPGIPVLWVGWSFGAPLQPVEPFSWFWAGAKEIVAISISAAKADVASACIIIARRCTMASVGRHGSSPQASFTAIVSQWRAMRSAQVDHTFRMPSWTPPPVGGLQARSDYCNCCIAAASRKQRSACSARFLSALVPHRSVPRRAGNSNIRQSRPVQHATPVPTSPKHRHSVVAFHRAPRTNWGGRVVTGRSAAHYWATQFGQI